MFLAGVITGAALIIAMVLIWYISGEDLLTGILSDDEMMYHAGKKDKMGSSKKAKDS